MEWQSITTRRAELRARFLDKLQQRRVIGPVELRQPFFGFVRRQFLAIDLRAVAHDARDDAKPRSHARARRDRRPPATRRRTSRCRVRRARGSHRDRRAGNRAANHRRAQFDGRRKQFLHEGVFGAAQARWRSSRLRLHEAGRIEPARMGRGENEGHGLARGARQRKGAA